MKKNRKPYTHFARLEARIGPEAFTAAPGSPAGLNSSDKKRRAIARERQRRIDQGHYPINKVANAYRNADSLKSALLEYRFEAGGVGFQRAEDYARCQTLWKQALDSIVAALGHDDDDYRAAVREIARIRAHAKHRFGRNRVSNPAVPTISPETRTVDVAFDQEPEVHIAHKLKEEVYDLVLVFWNPRHFFNHVAPTRYRGTFSAGDLKRTLYEWGSEAKDYNEEIRAAYLRLGREDEAEELRREGLAKEASDVLAAGRGEQLRVRAFAGDLLPYRDGKRGPDREPRARRVDNTKTKLDRDDMLYGENVPERERDDAGRTAAQRVDARLARREGISVPAVWKRAQRASSKK